MASPIQADQIKLRLKESLSGDPNAGAETIIVLSAKLEDLFASGYERDDIYGLVIPLLMQGKVRLDLDNRFERLEMEDQSQRFQRSNAIQVFEDYLNAYHPAQPVAAQPVAVRVAIPKVPVARA